MALPYLVNKVARQKKTMMLVRDAIHEEIETEERRAREKRTNSARRVSTLAMLMYNHPPPAVSSPIPVLLFTRVQRHSLRITWERLSEQSRRRKTRDLFNRIFENLTRKYANAFYKHKVCDAFSLTQHSMRSRLSSGRAHAEYLYNMLDTFVHELLSCPIDCGYQLPNLDEIVDVHMPLVTGGFPIDEAFTQLGASLTRHMLTLDAVQSCPQGKRAWMIFFAYICDLIPAEVMRRREHRTRLRNCQHLPFGRAPMRSKTFTSIGIAQLTAITTSQAIATAMHRSATSGVLHNNSTE